MMPTEAASGSTGSTFSSSLEGARRICLAESARPGRSSVQIVTGVSKTDARALLVVAAPGDGRTPLNRWDLWGHLA